VRRIAGEPASPDSRTPIAQPTAKVRRLPAAGWLAGTGLLALLALLTLAPGVARAHANLLTSSPRPGQQLGTVPGVWYCNSPNR
jgi:hypothetical protein